MNSPLQRQLFSLCDPGYKDFQCALMPTVDPGRVIGVRMPQLRKLARSFGQSSESSAFLSNLPHQYYEENNLHGLIICQNTDFDAVISLLDKFLPHVDNWATCDLLVPKSFKGRQADLLPHIRRWLGSDHDYTIRFAMGMLMHFYLDEAFSSEYPAMVAAVKREAYYVKMMAAWYFATALSKQYDEALPFLEFRRLERWTHNKAIQKAVESRRVTDEQKERLRSLRWKKD